MKGVQQMEINNFKSIRHLKLDGCKRINLFIGYPNVGKSNILEALALYSVKKEDQNLDEIIRFDNLTSLFFNGEISNKLEVILNEEYYLSGEYTQDFVQINLRKYVENSIDSDLYFKYEIRNSHRVSNHIKNKETELGISNIKKYVFSDIENTSDMPKGTLIDPRGENMFSVLSSNEKLRQEIAELFTDYNLRFSFDTNTRSFKILKNIGNDIFLISYSMIADTLKRLIFYKTAILSNQNSILLIEEPEAHMFPPFIRKFTSDIISDKTNQYFIATHSPYVLATLIEDATEDLAVFLVDYKNDNTNVKRLTKEDIEEIKEYGVDLFFNLESYLNHGAVNNA